MPETPTTSSTDLPPTVFVLYGATGDLARRMVLPAFFQLAQHGLLPADWRLIGSGRGERTDAEFVEHVRGALVEFGPDPDDGPWDDFAKRLRFAGGGFTAEDPGRLLRPWTPRAPRSARTPSWCTTSPSRPPRSPT